MEALPLLLKGQTTKHSYGDPGLNSFLKDVNCRVSFRNIYGVDGQEKVDK